MRSAPNRWYKDSVTIYTQVELSSTRRLWWSATKKATLTFKIQHRAIFTTPSLTLTNNNSRCHLLTQLRFPLFHRRQHHISHTSRWQSIQPPLNLRHRNDVQILRPSVVRTIDHRSHRQSQRYTELGTRGATTSTLRHPGCAFDDAACVCVSYSCTTAPQVGRCRLLHRHRRRRYATCNILTLFFVYDITPVLSYCFRFCLYHFIVHYHQVVVVTTVCKLYDSYTINSYFAPPLE